MTTTESHSITRGAWTATLIGGRIDVTYTEGGGDTVLLDSYPVGLLAEDEVADALAECLADVAPREV